MMLSHHCDASMKKANAIVGGISYGMSKRGREASVPQYKGLGCYTPCWSRVFKTGELKRSTEKGGEWLACARGGETRVSCLA